MSSPCSVERAQGDPEFGEQDNPVAGRKRKGAEPNIDPGGAHDGAEDPSDLPQRYTH